MLKHRMIIASILGILLFSSTFEMMGQRSDSLTMNSDTGDLFGTLNYGQSGEEDVLLIIIAGSGPTDRNGNNQFMQNNSLKLLADSLANYNISTFRFDKRGIAQSTQAGVNEKDLRFEVYVEDLISWYELIDSLYDFRQVYIAGHSEGSLIGMIAATRLPVKGFISLAGAGRPAPDIITEQLGKNAPMLVEESTIIMDSLKAGHEVKKINPFLLNLFRPSVQPYLISWFKYDPAAEINKLKIPVLVIQGETDIQTNETDANALADAAGVSVTMIEGMNHIFRMTPHDRALNIKSYYEKDTPISSAMVQEIRAFIFPN